MFEFSLSNKIQKNSLIELCITPEININNFLNKYLKTDLKIFTLDMFGESEIYSYNDLILELDNLKTKFNAILILNPITFIVDIQDDVTHESLLAVYNKLWYLIYKNNFTVFVINHFIKIKKQFFPRMGYPWQKILTHRIELIYNYETGKTDYRIHANVISTSDST